MSYTYGNATWGDLLTNWNGYAITYDTIGNPLQWKGASLTWKGRELQSYTKNADTLTFTYNDEGIRTSKEVNGVTHTYTLSGSQILTEEWGNYRVLYLYDENGAPLGFVYAASSSASGRYLYEKNIQGDIIGIFAAEGAKIGSYTYDAWGNCTVTPDSLATQEEIQILTNISPFRYRGYYYDVETGLYYLQSRYYDPEIGRFISPDALSYLGANNNLISYNIYAYCSNNPIKYVDPEGNVVISAIVIGAFIGFGLGFGSSILGQYTEAEGNWDEVDILEATYDGAWGAINGALAATGISAPYAIIAGVASGGMSSIGSDLLFNEGKINWENVAKNALIGGISACIAGEGADYNNGISKYLHSKNILNRTITNGTKSAIPRQAQAMYKHASDLVVSGIKYVSGNGLATIISKHWAG